MTKPSLAEQVVSLATLVQSQRQQNMINELKNQGLLNAPSYNLAYGSVSFSNSQKKS